MAGNRIGALKGAAKRWGVSLRVYLDRRARHLKPCTYCREWKHEDEYCSDESKWDGLAPACKPCHNKQRKHFYYKDVERSRARCREKDGRRREARIKAGRERRRRAKLTKEGGH